MNSANPAPPREDEPVPTWGRDFGRKGLIPLLLFGTIAACALEIVVMMTWPFMLGDRAVPGTVAAELTTDPLSVVLVYLFLVAATAWFTAIVLSMVTGGAKAVLIVVLPLLGAVFLFMFQGVSIFETAPSITRIIVFSAVALAGLGALTIVSALRNVMDRPTKMMSHAERQMHTQRYRQRQGASSSPLKVSRGGC